MILISTILKFSALLILIFSKLRNLFVMRPLSGTMFGFRMLSSQDTLLPLPRIQERIQDTGGWKVLSIIKGIPQVENQFYTKSVSQKRLTKRMKYLLYTFSRSKYFHLLLAPIKGFISLIG